MNEAELISGLLKGGLNIGTMAAVVVVLFRALRGQYEKRIKSMEKAVDACVFAKGELERQFSEDRKELQKQFNEDREAFHARFESLLQLTMEPRQKKRSPRTGG